MEYVEPPQGGLIAVWGGENIDAGTVDQAARTARLPITHGAVALMPDAHVGIGATVGSVVATRGAVIPSAVGVDIGCGMIAARTTLTASDMPDSLDVLHADLRGVVPAGLGNWHASPSPEAFDWFAQHPPAGDLKRDGDLYDRALAQYGTLGGGNHFLEVCTDETDGVWVVLHSGSRGVGNQLATRHIETAKLAAKLGNVALEDTDLAWLTEGDPAFEAYIADMLWCQEYAWGNRQQMMRAALAALNRQPLPPWDVVDAVNCHHNYCVRERHAGLEVWVTRKGAINAERGRMGIIPGSMATGTYIVEGLGNPEAYNSASHGAGRRLSRSQARKRLTVESLREAMGGRAWDADHAEALLDEHPESYKTIESVMGAQADLVAPRYRLTQVLNLKGTEPARRSKRK